MDPTRVRRGQPVADPFIWLHAFGLLRTGVGRNYLLEVPGQPHSGLAVAGGTIPRQFVSRRNGGQMFEQFIRIMRAKLRILGRMSREVVLDFLYWIVAIV